MSRTLATERAQPLVRHGGLLALLTGAAAIIALASLLLLIQTSRVATTGYDIRRLETIREDWRQRNYQLEAEIASLRSLDYIEKQATTKLKMVPATNPIYIEVKQPSKASLPEEIIAPSNRETAAQSKDGTGWLQQILNLIRFWEVT